MYVKCPLTILGHTPPTDVLMAPFLLSPVNFPVAAHRSRYHFQQALAGRGGDPDVAGIVAPTAPTGNPRSDGEQSCNLHQADVLRSTAEAVAQTQATPATPGPSTAPREDLAENSPPEKPKRKLHPCTRPGCTKAYKQLSGLRYHLTHVRSVARVRILLACSFFLTCPMFLTSRAMRTSCRCSWTSCRRRSPGWSPRRPLVLPLRLPLRRGPRPPASLSQPELTLAVALIFESHVRLGDRPSIGTIRDTCENYDTNVTAVVSAGLCWVADLPYDKLGGAPTTKYDKADFLAFRLR